MNRPEEFRALRIVFTVWIFIPFGAKTNRVLTAPGVREATETRRTCLAVVKATRAPAEPAGTVARSDSGDRGAPVRLKSATVTLAGATASSVMVLAPILTLVAPATGLAVMV